MTHRLVPKIDVNTKRWLGLAVLLIAETEVVLVPHFDARTGVKYLFFHLSLYHIMLGFIGFGTLLRLLAGPRLKPLPEARLDSRFVTAHVLTFLALLIFIDRMWWWSTLLSRPVQTLFWGAWIVVYMLTWLAALLPVREWAQTIRNQGLWLVGSFVVGCSAILISNASYLMFPPLASATFFTAGLLLKPWFSDTISDPEKLVMGTASFQVHIEPGCSGYEGIGLITLFTLCFLYMRRNDLKFPQAWALWPMAVAVIWVANSIRIALLVAIGTLFSPEVAVRGFHSQAGWIAFSLIGFLLVLLVEKFGWFRAIPFDHDTEEEVEERSYPAAPYLAPLLVSLFAQMLSQAFSVGFDVFYPYRTIAVAVVLALFWRTYRQLAGRPAMHAVLNGLVVYVLWNLMVHAKAGDTPETAAEALDEPLATIWLVFRVLGSSIVVPIVEELAFRGYLLRRFQSAYFDEVPIGKLTTFSVVASSLVFGALHSQIAAGVMAGLAYCLAVQRRGQLVDAIVAHGVTNLCISIEVLTLGHWYLW